MAILFIYFLFIYKFYLFILLLKWSRHQFNVFSFKWSTEPNSLNTTLLQNQKKKCYFVLKLYFTCFLPRTWMCPDHLTLLEVPAQEQCEDVGCTQADNTLRLWEKIIATSRSHSVLQQSRIQKTLQVVWFWLTWENPEIIAVRDMQKINSSVLYRRPKITTDSSDVSIHTYIYIFI